MKQLTLDLTLEQMVSADLKVFETDPVLFQQFPKSFFRDRKLVSATPKIRPNIPNDAKKFLKIKSLPKSHHVETNFHPYLKANKHTEKNIKIMTRQHGFDLASEELKNFTDDCFGLYKLFKSNSPVRASRLPTSASVPTGQSKLKDIKKRSGSFGKRSDCLQFGYRTCNLGSRNRFRSARSSPLSAYKAFRMAL